MIRAVGQWLVIDPISEGVKQTEGGLLLGEKHRDDIRYLKGEVISPGNEVKVVKKGDIILYDKHAGHLIELGSDVKKIIQQRDIVVVYE